MSSRASRRVPPPAADGTSGSAQAKGNGARDEMFDGLHELLRGYRATLEHDRRVLLEEFRLVDFARKVVGVGSVGTRAWIALMLGRDGQDPLFLQMKEAESSVLEQFLAPSERNRADDPQGHSGLRQAVWMDPRPRARPQRRPHRDRRLPWQRPHVRPRDRRVLTRLRRAERTRLQGAGSGRAVWTRHRRDGPATAQPADITPCASPS